VRTSAAVLLVAGVALWLAATATAQPAKPDANIVTRGQYLATIMDCGGCHTPGALAGQPDGRRKLAGSDIGFGGPFGVVYPKNLTPDRETGLGDWGDAEIARAIRHGQSRDGRPLLPVMPWRSYAALTPDDAEALVAYLRSIPPVKFAVPADVKPGGRATAPYLTVVSP
jgi:mono/diheme cytochrome c family protein